MTSQDGMAITARYPLTGKYMFIIVTPSDMP